DDADFRELRGFLVLCKSGAGGQRGDAHRPEKGGQASPVAALETAMSPPHHPYRGESIRPLIVGILRQARHRACCQKRREVLATGGGELPQPGTVRSSA